MRFSLTLLLCALLLASVAGQRRGKYRPWTEWSKKEAEAILNDSPWGQTQTETDVSELFFRPQAAPDARTGASRADPERDERGGATNQAASIYYRIRLLSAKPVREAFARLILLRQPTTDGAIASSLQEFINRDFGRWIVVAVSGEAHDQRLAARALQDFHAAVTDTLKHNTYLERGDGRRLFLHTYQAPGADGLGAKFVFTRVVDGRDFLTPDTGGRLRFFAEVGGRLKLDVQFKLSEMGYEGRLAY